MTTAERQALLATPLIILIGAVVAWAGSQGGDRVGSLPLFALCGLLAFGINWLVFLHAYAAQTERFFDLTGSLTYMTLVGTALALAGDPDDKRVVGYFQVDPGGVVRTPYEPEPGASGSERARTLSTLVAAAPFAPVRALA